VKAEEIERMVLEDNPTLQKGDKLWPSAHQKAVTKIWQAMPEAEKADLERERANWAKQGPPMNVRLRYDQIFYL